MTVRDASLEYVEPMWRGADSRDDGGRYPMLWVIPGDHRVLVSVREAARKMRKSGEEVERLVALGFLYTQREGGELKVEPPIVN